ncbi:homoserine dehydrogenase [Caldanaerobius fijiensis DSM 17918]|uniref:Homoserine dehydrogenase n=1 Tax=Caldanaerobius fijiensis DSM 17918 TaxID=1121256 RepID=A0A1M4W137_9THEO|nr:homoserine dehydrogenase [Caldanaerobius fijiensis DSM 17918]
MINIGILGLGTVGSGIIRIFNENSELIKKRIGDKINVKKVLVRDLHKNRDVEIDKNLLTTNPDDVLQDPEIDIVVEVIGGINPALDFVLKAIENKKHVVTANKEMMAKEGWEILTLARKKGVDVYYEASVAGGIPIIRPMKESLTANKIEEILGIINGTTNYILTKMAKEGKEYEDALREAQNLGYAEADPTSDVEGYDARYKLAILATLAFGTKVNVMDIYTEGITRVTKTDIKYAEELGYAIKLLAIGRQRKDGLELRVHPAFIEKNHPLAQVNDVFNGIFIKGNAIGEIMLYGRGAGQMPTASAVVADIIDIIRNIKAGTVNRVVSEYDDYIPVIDMNSIVSRYYIRIRVKDKPGVMASIAKVFGDHGVSLQSIIQKDTKGEEAEIVLFTHDIVEKSISDALVEVRLIPTVIKVESVIREIR